MADCVTRKTAHRDKILEEFKAGQIQALTSVGVLTTGFDFPDIDLIVMMRPTMSPGLYLQMAGRGGVACQVKRWKLPLFRLRRCVEQHTAL